MDKSFPREAVIVMILHEGERPGVSRPTDVRLVFHRPHGANRFCTSGESIVVPRRADARRSPGERPGVSRPTAFDRFSIARTARGVQAGESALSLPTPLSFYCRTIRDSIAPDVEISPLDRTWRSCVIADFERLCRMNEDIWF